MELPQEGRAKVQQNNDFVPHIASCLLEFRQEYTQPKFTQLHLCHPWFLGEYRVFVPEE
jgi:hypothetical protein